MHSRILLLASIFDSVASSTISGTAGSGPNSTTATSYHNTRLSSYQFSSSSSLDQLSTSSTLLTTDSSASYGMNSTTTHLPGTASPSSTTSSGAGGASSGFGLPGSSNHSTTDLVPTVSSIGSSNASTLLGTSLSTSSTLHVSNTTSKSRLGTGSLPQSTPSFSIPFNSTSSLSTLMASVTAYPIGTGGFSITKSGSDYIIGNTTLFPGGGSYVKGSTTYDINSYGGLEINSVPTSPTTAAIPSSTTARSLTEVTSTMTTIPSGVSTKIITGSNSYSQNTWVTTTGSDHSSTIVPIIVPCPGCAPIIVWNVPPIPKVTFDWPKFPKLPTFHFPCIKIFGIHISGDCPNPPPPETDGPPPEKPTPTGPPPSDTPTSTDGPSSSSSSESCTETQTASDCRIMCKTTTSFAASSASATETCTTSCFNTVRGCSVTGLTTTTTVSSNSTTSATSTTDGGNCVIPTPIGGTGIQTGIRECQIQCPTGDAGVVERSNIGSVAGRIRYEKRVITIEKRRGGVGPEPVLQVGPPAGIHGCPIPQGVRVNIPFYPDGGDIWDLDRPGANPSLQGVSTGIARWLVTQTPAAGQCNPSNPQQPVPTLISNNDYLKYSGRFPTMDHAFEKNWLKFFWRNIITNRANPPRGQINCQQLNNWFFKTNSQQNTPIGSANRMQAVYDALAGAQNIVDMIAMQREMNADQKGLVAFIDNIQSEGNVFFPNNQALQVPANANFAQAQSLIQRKLQFLTNLQMGVAIMNYQPVQDAMMRTCYGIYTALKQVDNDIRCNFPGITAPSFRQAWIDYMTDKFNNANTGLNPNVQWYAHDVKQSVYQDVVTMQKIVQTLGNRITPQQQTIYNRLLTEYNRINQLGNPQAGDTAWTMNFNAIPPANILKRQEADGDSCPLGSGDGSSTESGSETGTESGSAGSHTQMPGGVSANATITTASPGATITNGTVISTLAPTRTNSSVTSIFTPYCGMYQNPQEGASYCTCSDGARYEPNNATNGLLCPTASPGPSGLLITTSTSSTPTSAWTSLTTDPIGDVIACTSWSSFYSPIKGSICVGSTVSTPEPPYATGTCNVHIWEGSEGWSSDVGVQLTVHDGAGNQLEQFEQAIAWGETVTAFYSDTQLPWDLVVGFPEQLPPSSKRSLAEKAMPSSLKGRAVLPPPPIPDPFEKWIVNVTFGETQFDSTHTDSNNKPYCSVGGWDNGDFDDWLDDVLSLGAIEHLPNRQLDCYFPC